MSEPRLKNLGTNDITLRGWEMARLGWRRRGGHNGSRYGGERQRGRADVEASASRRVLSKNKAQAEHHDPPRLLLAAALCAQQHNTLRAPARRIRALPAHGDVITGDEEISSLR